MIQKLRLPEEEFPGIEDGVITTIKVGDELVTDAGMKGRVIGSVKGITGAFIERQEISWLHEFYKWLSETKHRTDISTDKTGSF